MQGRFQIGAYWLSKRPGSDNWQRTWFDRRARQTRRVSIGTTDLREAQVRLAEWVVLNQPSKGAEDLPLAQITLRYYEHHGKHAASQDAIKHNLRHWTDFFQGSMLSEVTKAEQEAFIRHLKGKGLSDGYIQRIFTIGRAAVNYALENGEITKAPTILYVPAESKKARALTQEEAAAWIAASDTEHGLMYFALAFNTWARERAILELTRFQVKLEERLIHLNPPGRTQNKKRRPTVPITDTLLPAVKHATGDTLVNWHGRPIKSVKKMLLATAARAKIGPVNSRTIRHTMATWARNEGVPWPEIEAMLGHSLKSTSEKYTRTWIPSHDGAAAKATDKFLAATQLQRTDLWKPHSCVAENNDTGA